MPIKIPVRGDYDSSGTPTGLSEFQSGEYVSTPFGGTGQSTYSSGEILVGNASGSLTRNKLNPSGIFFRDHNFFVCRRIHDFGYANFVVMK